MGCGVLDTKATRVPGTSRLTDTGLSHETSGSTDKATDLKYGTGRNSHIVLVPQPSNDPNDPLKWPKWRKYSCLFAVLFAVVMSGVAGPLLSPAQIVIQDEFETTLARSSQATAGWLVFGLAVGTLFWGPSMQKLGRRPIFLLAGLLMAVGSFVAAAAKTYTTLVVGRVLIGLGMGPAECLSGAVIGDLFYVHERGVPMALYNLAVVNGINISPAISGVVVQRIGWRYPSWIFGAFAAAAVVCQFFFQPETLFLRQDTPEAASPTGPNTPVGAKHEVDQISLAAYTSNQQPKSFASALNPWSGIFQTQASVWQMFYRPFILTLSPIALYGFIVYGVAVAFIVMVSVSAAYLFSFPPYNFGPEESGYIYFSPLIGSFLAALLVGLSSDSISTALARRNKGIYEPEFRLPLMAVYGLFTGCGYLGWGVSAQYLKPWIAPVVSFGIVGFGQVFGLTLSVAYVVDSFGGASASALTTMMVMKNFLCFSVSYWAAPWIISRKVIDVFAVIACIHFAAGLLTIPMYMYGKRARALTAKYIHFEDDASAAAGH